MGLVYASLLIVVVLYGGKALVEVYQTQIEPNPRRFEDADAFLEFVVEREREDPNYKLGAVLAVVGLVLVFVGWGNLIEAVSGFWGATVAGSPDAGGGFLATMFWFLFVGAGIELLARGCDGAIVGYVQVQKVRRFAE